MPVTPTKITVSAVQFTIGRQPVVVAYEGVDVRTGPMAGVNLWHTTQVELGNLAPEAVRLASPGYWGDAEVETGLLAALAESGIAVEIVANDESVVGG
jgi:hypothetical protein